MTEKWAFIINPVAGNGSAQSQLPKLREMIKKHKIDAEIVYTERSAMQHNCRRNTWRKGSDILQVSEEMAHLMKLPGH